MSDESNTETNGQIPAIQFVNLTRKFGNFTAVDSIDLSVPKGSFFGFLGPNGAGKSTSINMMTGLLKPTSGKIIIDGIEMSGNPISVKKILGIVPENLNLYDRLKAREHIEFSGALYGLSREESVQRTKEILNLLDVNGEKYIADLSMGMRKKVSLGAALIHKPRILILDEPFISVDAISARKIKDILQKMIRSGVTIFMTSHIMEVVEKLCDRLAIIHNGKIHLNGLTSEILAGADGSTCHTLEDVFVNLLGVDIKEGELSWIS